MQSLDSRVFSVNLKIQCRISFHVTHNGESSYAACLFIHMYAHRYMYDYDRKKASFLQLDKNENSEITYNSTALQN